VAAALLAACPAVAVLATSREPLGLPAEAVFPIPPMAIPPGDAGPGTPLETYDAALLFLARAEQAVPGLTVTPSDVPVVARICRRLDGLPLAIELAASRQKVLSVAEIDKRLADRFRLLRRPTAADDVPARQRTLRATIDWSYALLEQPERRLLHRLSVFSGGFGLTRWRTSAPATGSTRRRCSTCSPGWSTSRWWSAGRTRAAPGTGCWTPSPPSPGSAAPSTRTRSGCGRATSGTTWRWPPAPTRSCGDPARPSGWRAWTPSRTTSAPPCAGAWRRPTRRRRWT
jgi:hypothetical protein